MAGLADIDVLALSDVVVQVAVSEAVDQDLITEGSLRPVRSVESGDHGEGIRPAGCRIVRGQDPAAPVQAGVVPLTDLVIKMQRLPADADVSLKPRVLIIRSAVRAADTRHLYIGRHDFHCKTVILSGTEIKPYRLPGIGLSRIYEVFCCIGK